MKYSRLAVEANGRTFKLQFHPRLTVITGVGPGTRESLVRELIGALGSNRSGTHVEVQTDDGRRFTVFRPPEATHRVIDMATGADVSDEFRSPSAIIDLLHPHGLDVATARRWMRIGPNDLATTTRSQQLISRLADLDQSDLWSAAARVRGAEQRLNDEAHRDDPHEDGELVEQIEGSQQALEQAVERAETSRRLAMQVGAVCLLSAVLIMWLGDDFKMALLTLAIAVAVILAAFYFRRRSDTATARLQEALKKAGADSYLGFHLSRIDTYVTGEAHRRKRATAGDDARDAAARWHAIAGDVTVDWALLHREAIVAAARMRHAPADDTDRYLGVDDVDLGADTEALLPALSRGADETGELVDALLHRLTRVRRMGTGEESFPLLLDEPFATLDPATKPALLELLLEHAGNPQVILLTNDEDVVAWARLESITGALDLIGPGTGTQRAPSAPTGPLGAEAPQGNQRAHSGPNGGPTPSD